MKSVPLELRASSRWITWEIRDGGKFPLNAKTGRGQRGFLDDPAIWSTFAYVSKRKPSPSKEEGWALIVGSPFVVVDIDECVEDGKINNRGANIIKQLPATYAELSPSGNGLHLWYRCAKHEELPAQSVAAFEVYARRRFMTVTGNRVGTIETLTELSVTDALSIFRLANPAFDEDDEPYTNEEGCWSEPALEALLKAWAENIKGFQYTSLAGRWAIPCPRYEQHTVKRNVLSRDTQVWIQNGHVVSHCFHMHCQDQTWGDIIDHYDPEHVFFDLDEWQEKELNKLDLL